MVSYSCYSSVARVSEWVLEVGWPCVTCYMLCLFTLCLWLCVCVKTLHDCYTSTSEPLSGHLCGWKVKLYSVRLTNVRVRIQRERASSAQKGRGQRLCGRAAALARLPRWSVCMDSVAVLLLNETPCRCLMTHRSLHVVNSTINYRITSSRPASEWHSWVEFCRFLPFRWQMRRLFKSCVAAFYDNGGGSCICSSLGSTKIVLFEGLIPSGATHLKSQSLWDIFGKHPPTVLRQS